MSETGASSQLSAAPRAPSNLSEVARAEWDRLAALLVNANLLTERDLGTLEAYCITFGNVRLAQNEIDNWGVTISTEQGVRKNPACGVVQEQMGRLLAFGAELGLSPVSRRRIAGGESAKPKNPFAEF